MRGISSPILPSSQSGLPLPSGVRWRRTVAALLITLPLLSISFFTFAFYSDINSLIASRYAYASPTTPEASAAEVVLELNPSATMPEVSLNLVPGGEEGTPEDLDEQDNFGQKTCRQASLIRQKYGKHNVQLSRAHEGSSYRVKQVLSRASKGEALKVGLLGGSVSSGHGTSNGKHFVYGAIPPSKQWHSPVFQWFNRTFPNPDHEFVVGSKPAVASDYFAWCFLNHIPVDVDLIMVEMAVNDEFDDRGLESSETLVRRLLSLPSNPAVIFVSAFSLRTQSGRGGMTNGGDAHLIMSSWYDIPLISMRNILAPALLSRPRVAQPFFDGDVRHFTAVVHEAMGEMVVAYLDDTLCGLADESEGVSRGSLSEGGGGDRGGLWPGEKEVLGVVPRLRITDPWNSKKEYSTSLPSCSTAGENLEPLPGSNGFSVFSWKDTKFYYESLDPGSTISIAVNGVRDGQVSVSYLKSSQYGLGMVRCWLDEDDQRDGKVLDGYWKRKSSVAITEVITESATPGDHILHCRSLTNTKDPGGGTRFRLVGVMSV